MGVARHGELTVLRPNLQISFYYRLQEVRAVYLDEALAKAVREADQGTLDGELRALVPRAALQRMTVADASRPVE